MEKQELIALLDGLSWYQAGKWRQAKLATIELSPHIRFDINHHNYAKSLDAGAKEFIDNWSISFEIHGNSSGVNLSSPDQAKTYLLNQYNKLPEYFNLIAKRQRLGERIRPLRNKMCAYGDKIFELAKSL